MSRMLSCFCLTAALAAAPAILPAQQAASDPDVLKGIQQVEDGDYDAAILTLDNAARRLAADPTKSKELSQAYLYLGIAYVGKGHEAAARAKFREAVKQLKDLSLSPEKFPPRVIDLFEAAKEEEAQKAAAQPAPQTAQKKKGGGKKGLILVGAGVAAAGGGALVLLGKKDEGGDDTIQYESRQGVLTVAQTAQEIQLGPGGAGHWKAQLSWNNATAVVKMSVKDAAGNFVVEARQVTPTSSEAEFDGAPGGIYRFAVGLVNNVPTPVSFELNVEFPKP